MHRYTFAYDDIASKSSYRHPPASQNSWYFLTFLWILDRDALLLGNIPSFAIPSANNYILVLLLLSLLLTERLLLLLLSLETLLSLLLLSTKILLLLICMIIIIIN